MQCRTAFNGGEFAPEMETRSDLEKYTLGCDKLENWEVGQLGGIRRRRGMRKLCYALEAGSHIVPYIYSYAEVDHVRFLIEIASSQVRVLAMDGSEVARFKSGDELVSGEGRLRFAFVPHEVRAKQINKLLILTSLTQHPMVLKFDGETWEFEPFEFSHIPFRYVRGNELRETSILVNWSGEEWSVEWSEEEDANETAALLKDQDLLRVSYWAGAQEESSPSRDLRANVSVVEGVPESARAGDKFAVREDEGLKYYVCTADFNASSYVAGLESPANYTSNFLVAENTDGFDEVKPVYSIHEVNNGGNISKGTKIAIYSAYWKYYTCIKDFAEREEGYSDFESYPSWFISGLAVGNPLPCGGKWSFYCSGLWYGSYEVRRNYETSLLTDDWAVVGSSFSRNDNASNVQPSGDESSEECYLRLFLTRSRCMGATIDGGFPADSCYNRLIVENYKHDVTLVATPLDDGSGVVWRSDDVILPPAGKRISTKDWSWAAFSERYGFPLLCDIFNTRLVFASTMEQPQSVWMSRTDDLNNFLVGDTDAASIQLTLNTISQNPICWTKTQNKRLLLGTSEAEYLITSSTGAITNANATLEEHSHVGSDGVTAIAMDEKVIYVGRGGWRVYEYGYNYESDGYISRDLSLLAPHIGPSYGGISGGAVQTKPDTVAMFVLGCGQLALCTYNNAQEVRAWHRWTTDGLIKDVCILPDGRNRDKIYLLVERDDQLQLEVVDDDSPFVDDGGRDYVSVVVTNTLRSAFEEPVRKCPSYPFWVFFNDDFSLVDGMSEFSTNGGWTWFHPNCVRDCYERGWHEIIAPGGNTFSRKIGIRVSGDREAWILAVQG